MPNAQAPARFNHYYEVHGEGRPVLLVHGFGVSSYSWRHLVGPLSKHHRVIVVDLKGFGSSPKPCDEKYTVFDQADLLYDFIIRHDLKDLTLVGHSMGGGVVLWTSFLLSERDPARLSRLVLVDSVGAVQRHPRFIALARLPVLGPLGLWLFPAETHVRAALRESYYDATKITDDAVRTYAEALKTPGGRHAVIRTARSLDPKDVDRVRLCCEKIEVPTLILWGREDRVIPLKVGEHLHEAIRTSRLVIVDGCGHMPQEEKPEETLELIEDFLDTRDEGTLGSR